MGCKWLFTIKYNANGSIKWYKEKHIAKKYTQTYRIDYQEAFTLYAKINIVISPIVICNQFS